MSADEEMTVRIQRAVKATNMSLRELGKELSVSAGAISHWTNGMTIPTLTNIRKLAELAGMDPAWITFGIDRRSEEQQQSTMLVPTENSAAGKNGMVAVPEIVYDQDANTFVPWRSWTIPVDFIQMTLRVSTESIVMYEIQADAGPNLKEFDYAIVDRSQSSHKHPGTYLITFQGVPVVRYLRPSISGAFYVQISFIGDDPSDDVNGYLEEEDSKDLKIIGKVVASVSRYRDSPFRGFSIPGKRNLLNR